MPRLIIQLTLKNFVLMIQNSLEIEIMSSCPSCRKCAASNADACVNRVGRCCECNEDLYGNYLRSKCGVCKKTMCGSGFCSEKHFKGPCGK